MARIHFTPHLQRHLSCKTTDVPGATVAEALGAARDEIAGLRGYVLDDLGRVRQHVMIFVDDQTLADRTHLSDPLQPASSIYCGLSPADRGSPPFVAGLFEAAPGAAGWLAQECHFMPMPCT